MTETQQRFLRAIADRLGARPVVEVRLFPAIRQGPHESGVAVVAVEEAGDEEQGETVPAVSGPDADVTGLQLHPNADREAASTGQPPPASAALGTEGSAQPETADSSRPRSNPLPAPAAGNHSLAAGGHPRLSILTARFRLTVKGPDRGKWEFDLVHDADAPLETIEPVVRGVARRVGDAGEPDLLSPAAFHRAVTEPWWTATT